ncbi:MAG: ChbG/HpnK family deacetylase [Verrucomicrobia bacterium]|nr:MAG: ChbG/HpnK family deacetylase [Verrucomicrobiota bacterium]
MKRLTLCADDFGQSVAISKGILQLVAAGRLQAVSCLTESPAWPAMAQQLKALGTHHQTGLHFNLTHGFAAAPLVCGEAQVPAQAVGTGTTLAKCRATDEAHAPAQAVGTGTTLAKCRATDEAHAPAQAVGTGTTLAKCRATDEAHAPAQAVGTGTTLAKCRATDKAHAPAQAVGPLILRALLHRLDAAAVRQRFVQQWEAFEAHYGQPPAFVDGHQHVHAFPQIRRIVIEETRRRNPAAWLRVPHACGFLPKVLVLRAMTAGLAASARHAGLASNTRFAGFRPFRSDFDVAQFFRHLLAGAGDSTLVMCHPGLAADDPADPIANCRQAELNYLLSDQFAADLAAANVSSGACSCLG